VQAQNEYFLLVDVQFLDPRLFTFFLYLSLIKHSFEQPLYTPEMHEQMAIYCQASDLFTVESIQRFLIF
jgi:hypothetical protein